MLVKDEADVVAQTIAHHLSWADSLSICDHASADGTSQIIAELARSDRRITHLNSGSIPFSNGLRAFAFEQVRQDFEPGDWIAIADADEMFHVAPPEFVREHLSPLEGSVHSLHLDFVLTQSEAARLMEPADCLAERARPITERRTRCAYLPHGEFRLFQYRRSMRWPYSRYEPLHPGLLARAHIPIRHYRARDPLQLQARCQVRRACRRFPEDHHWNLQWTDLVCSDDARLHIWKPGFPLPTPIPTFTGLSGTRRIIRAIAYQSPVITTIDKLRSMTTVQPALPPFK